jgi:hypothetical protein
MTYACPTREYTADAYLLKLQRLQNRVLHASGHLDRRALIREMHYFFIVSSGGMRLSLLGTSATYLAYCTSLG